MNSPYTKHLDAAPSSVTTVPQYQTAPAPQMTPMVIQSGNDGGGGKAVMGLVAIILAAIACVAGYFIGQNMGPSWNELRRYEALAGREGEIRGRDNGWLEGRKQGRVEMEFLAKYEKLRTQATAFNSGWSQGLNTGKSMGVAQGRARYGYNNGYGRGYGYGNGYNRGSGWGRGYGYGGHYGGAVNNAISQAQNMANATGSPVDVIVG